MCATQVTGAYSIEGRDLRSLLALLKPVDGGAVAPGAAPAHSVLLLRTLAAMAGHSGPAAFFDFGDDGAGIMRSQPLRCAALPSDANFFVLARHTELG